MTNATTRRAKCYSGWHQVARERDRNGALFDTAAGNHVQLFVGDLGVAVAQTDGAVEHRLARRRVLVAREVTLALELHRFGGVVGRERRLDARLAQHLERVWIELGGEVRDVRLRLGEERII